MTETLYSYGYQFSLLNSHASTDLSTDLITWAAYLHQPVYYEHSLYQHLRINFMVKTK